MPANLTPQYHEAEARYRKAKTIQEKIAALEEMMRVIPKHKGTEKMRADLKRRLSKHRSAAEAAGGAKSGYHITVEREGEAQLALIGPPNAGKSALLAALTNARPEIANYPYTTQRPMSGMMPYENIQFQLVDNPAISDSFFESWLRGIIRNADLILVVADLAARTVLEDLETVFNRLKEAKIQLIPTIDGETRTESVARRPALLLGNKCDQPGALDNGEIIHEIFPVLEYIPVSAETGAGLKDLKRAVYAMLEIMRVYTKARGKDPDIENPFVLPIGSTVDDVARQVHKDLANQLKFARLWGSGQFDGQRVARDYVLVEGDIIEIVA